MFSVKNLMLFMMLSSFSFCLSASTWSDVKKQVHRLMSEPIKTTLFYCKIAAEGAGTVVAGRMAWDEFFDLIDQLKNQGVKLEKHQLHSQLRQILIVGGLGLITHKCLKSFISDIKKL